jgi:preprotein translocase subunit SecG
VLIFASTIHVLLCVFMIFVILLQPGKDAGMGSALGGGAATSAFGGRGAVTFLGKVTAVCAVGFFLTSLGLSFVGMRSSVAAGLTAEPAGVTATDTKKDEAKKDAPPPSGMQQGAPSTDVPPSNVPAQPQTAPAGPK